MSSIDMSMTVDMPDYPPSFKKRKSVQDVEELKEQSDSDSDSDSEDTQQKRTYKIKRTKSTALSCTSVQQKYTYKIKNTAPDVARFITYFSYVEKEYLEYYDTIFNYEYLLARLLIHNIISENIRNYIENIKNIFNSDLNLNSNIENYFKTIINTNLDLMQTDNKKFNKNFQTLYIPIINKRIFNSLLELRKQMSEIFNNKCKNMIDELSKIVQNFDNKLFKKVYNKLNFISIIDNRIDNFKQQNREILVAYDREGTTDEKINNMYKKFKYEIDKNFSILVANLNSIFMDINDRLKNLEDIRNQIITDNQLNLQNYKKNVYRNMCFKLDTIHDFTGSRVKGSIRQSDIFEVLYWKDLMSFIDNNNIKKPVSMENNLLYWILRHDYVQLNNGFLISGAQSGCYIHNKAVPLYVSASVENFADDMARMQVVINMSVDAGESRIERFKNLLLFNSYIIKTTGGELKEEVTCNLNYNITEVVDDEDEEEEVEDKKKKSKKSKTIEEDEDEDIDNTEEDQEAQDIISNLTLEKLISDDSNIKFQIIFPQIFDANPTTGKTTGIKGQKKKADVDNSLYELDFNVLDNKCKMIYVRNNIHAILEKVKKVTVIKKTQKKQTTYEYVTKENVNCPFVQLTIFTGQTYPVKIVKVYQNEIPQSEIQASEQLFPVDIKLKDKFYYRDGTLICKGIGPGVNELTRIYTHFKNKFTRQDILKNIFLIKRIGDYSQIFYSASQNYLYSSNDRMSATFSYIEGTSFIGPFKDAGIFLNFQENLRIETQQSSCYKTPTDLISTDVIEDEYSLEEKKIEEYCRDLAKQELEIDQQEEQEIATQEIATQEIATQEIATQEIATQIGMETEEESWQKILQNLKDELYRDTPEQEEEELLGCPDDEDMSTGVPTSIFPFFSKTCSPDISDYLKFVNTLEQKNLTWYDKIYKHEYNLYSMKNSITSINDVKKIFLNMAFKLDTIHDFIGGRVDKKILTKETVLQHLFPKNLLEENKIPHNLENNFFYWIVQRQNQPLSGFCTQLFNLEQDRPDLVFSASIENFADCIAQTPTLISIDASEVRIDNFKNILMFNDIEKDINKSSVTKTIEQLQYYQKSKFIAKYLHDNIEEFNKSMENFSEIFNYIDRLNPDNKNYDYFYADLYHNIRKQIVDTEKFKNIIKLFNRGDFLFVVEFFTNIFKFIVYQLNYINIDDILPLTKNYIQSLFNATAFYEIFVSKQMSKDCTKLRIFSIYTEKILELEELVEYNESEVESNYNNFINRIQDKFEMDYNDKFFEVFNINAHEEIMHRNINGVNFKIIIPQLFDANVTTGKSIKVKNINVSSNIDYDGLFCKNITENFNIQEYNTRYKQALNNIKNLFINSKDIVGLISRFEKEEYTQYNNFINNPDYVSTIFPKIKRQPQYIQQQCLAKIIPVNINFTKNIAKNFYDQFKLKYFEINKSITCKNEIQINNIDFLSQIVTIYDSIISPIKSKLQQVNIEFTNFNGMYILNNQLTYYDNDDLFSFLSAINSTIEKIKNIITKLNKNERTEETTDQNILNITYNLYRYSKSYYNIVYGKNDETNSLCNTQILNTTVRTSYTELIVPITETDLRNNFSKKLFDGEDRFDDKITPEILVNLIRGIVFDRIEVDFDNQEYNFPIKKIIILNYNFKENIEITNALKETYNYFNKPIKNIYDKLDTNEYTIEVLKKYIKNNFSGNFRNIGTQTRPFYLINGVLYGIMGPGVKDLINIYNEINNEEDYIQYDILENIFTIKRAGDYLQVLYCKTNDHIFISNDRMSASFSFIENCNFIGPFKDAGLFIKNINLYNNCVSCDKDKNTVKNINIDSFSCEAQQPSVIMDETQEQKIKTNVGVFNKFLNMFTNSLKIK